jgi:hypothetical protein
MTGSAGLTVGLGDWFITRPEDGVLGVFCALLVTFVGVGVCRVVERFFAFGVLGSCCL